MKEQERKISPEYRKGNILSGEKGVVGKVALRRLAKEGKGGTSGEP